MILINCQGRTCLEIWGVIRRRQCQMRTPTIISNEGVTKILVCRCGRGGGIDFGGWWWYVCPRYSDTTTLWHTLGDSQIWQDVRTYNNNKNSCTGKIDWKENMLNKQQCRWNSVQQHEGWPLLKYLAKHGGKNTTITYFPEKEKKGALFGFSLKYILASTIL